LLDDNLKPVATHSIDNLGNIFDFTLGVKQRNDQNGKYFGFQKGNNRVVLSLAPNPLHYLKWLILLGYYFGVTAIVYLSQKIYQSRVNRSQKLEKELLRLQTQLATSQLDPHFVSNSLNSINAFVLLNKNLDAFEYLVKFSNLVEETLRSSDHIFRTLEAELSFVGNFLDLEKKRKANFDYRVEIEPNVDKKTLVPKMAIHIFAENSVKHGFYGSEKGGLLVIDVSQKLGLLEVIIKDNGIGLKKAAKYSEYSTKKGLMTISKIFDLHQKLFNRDISYSIKSLTPENDGQTGTEICIKIETNHGGVDG
jgi:LytS/YehU family sensor histidine kinase